MTIRLAPSPHTIPLTDQWSLWRQLVVRGAGFPAEEVLRLGDSNLMAVADSLTKAAHRFADAMATAMRSAGGDARLLRAVKRLQSGKREEQEIPELAPVVEARNQFDEARALFDAQYAAVTTEAGRALRELVRQEHFCEALLWQNPQLLTRGIASLLRSQPGETGFKVRQNESVAASYLQRYCTKNDTIGFFGPIGWGRFSDEGAALEARPGPGLVASRRVYFEHWPMAEVARTLEQDPALRPWLRPRRNPTVRVEGERFMQVGGREGSLPLPFARILAACDGARAAVEIAEAALLDEALELSEVDEVYAILEELSAKRLVSWGLELPAVPTAPDAALRELLMSCRDPEARGRALAMLDELDQQRARVAAAAGAPSRLTTAITSLEEAFMRLTRKAATRNEGVTYGARTIFYEDCRRDLELTVGPAVRARLSAPLSLVLDSARWFTYTVAARYRRALVDCFRECASEVVEYAQFSRVADRLFTFDARRAAPLVDEVSGELRQRWATLFGAAGEDRAVMKSSGELRHPAQDQFAAPGPGWPSAREHCPDLLIAAASVDAINRGEAVYVLGEMHVALNTVVVPAMLQQAVNPEALVEAHCFDLPEPRVAPVMPLETLHRAVLTSPNSHDIDLEQGATRSWRPRAQVIAVSDLVVRERDGQLGVSTRDGRHFWEIIAFYDQQLTFETANHFGFFPVSNHQPRMTIDDLVVARETWRFTSSQLGFASASTPADRFLAARQWSRQHLMPRFVFVRSAEEVKPCFIDFASPTYVEILSRLARKASTITVSEMLPAPSEVWLPDADGRRYSCELRMVAVDGERWRA